MGALAFAASGITSGRLPTSSACRSCGGCACQGRLALLLHRRLLPAAVLLQAAAQREGVRERREGAAQPSKPLPSSTTTSSTLATNGAAPAEFPASQAPPAHLDELDELVAGCLVVDAPPHNLLAHVQVNLARGAAHVAAEAGAGGRSANGRHAGVS